MVEKVYSNPDIFKIYVPLPNNPLKNLNSLVIRTDAEDMIIDTGFNMDECYEALTEGLKEIGVEPNGKNTVYFLTHMHSDHIGLMPRLITDDTKIYMGAFEYAQLLRSNSKSKWELDENRFLKEGFPMSEILVARETNPARKFAPSKHFEAITLEDGEKFTVGGYEFTAILTPGHTPGHMCLYMEKEKILFSGDHVLFDITPNITCWAVMKDSLASYLESLEKVKKLDIKTCFPAHRHNDMDTYVRIDEILKHHDARLNNTLDVMRQTPGSTAYEIAGAMKWKLRGRNWAEFPVAQKWFAMGETLSHLDYLYLRDRIRFEEIDGIKRYWVKE